MQFRSVQLFGRFATTSHIERAEDSVQLRLSELQPSRNAVSGIEQTAPGRLRQPHLSLLKGRFRCKSLSAAW